MFVFVLVSSQIHFAFFINFLIRALAGFRHLLFSFRVRDELVSRVAQIQRGLPAHPSWIILSFQGYILSRAQTVLILSSVLVSRAEKRSRDAASCREMGGRNPYIQTLCSRSYRNWRSDYFQKLVDAEPSMFVQSADRFETIAASRASYFSAAVCVHSFVPTQVWELSVRSATYLAHEWFHTAVYVHVLFESASRGEEFPAYLAGVVAVGRCVFLVNMRLHGFDGRKGLLTRAALKFSIRVVSARGCLRSRLKWGR